MEACNRGGNAGNSCIVIDGFRLSLAEVVRVASGVPGYSIDLPKEARIRMAGSVNTKDRLISAKFPIYGTTTGFGDSSGRRVRLDKITALQRNLLRFLRVGTGSMAPLDVIRAAMIIRANCAARGNSGIREDPIILLLDLLERDILPVIPERGSVGASGDLAPLSYLAAVLTGEGMVYHQGAELSAADALAANNLQPVELLAKEGLALVNGTSFMAAYAALAFTEASKLAWVTELCTSFATELRHGSRDQFAPFPHLHKPHPGQITSATNIFELLTGSLLTVSDSNLTAPFVRSGQAYLELECRIQDPYSIRCAPHVIGVLRDTMTWVEQWLTNEINSSNDNPLFDVENDLVYNSGNFYGGHVAHAAQALTSAVASVADLLDRQLALLVDDKFNLGLTPNLIAHLDPEDPNAGVHHGFKGAQIAASALTAEALHLTLPAGSFSRSTEAHNQDKVSMGTIAARHARTATELASEVAAIHLLALCQAADLVGPNQLGKATSRVYRYMRSKFPPVDQDRPLDAEVRLVGLLIRSGALQQETVGDGRETLATT